MQKLLFYYFFNAKCKGWSLHGYYFYRLDLFINWSLLLFWGQFFKGHQLWLVYLVYYHDLQFIFVDTVFLAPYFGMILCITLLYTTLASHICTSIYLFMLFYCFLIRKTILSYIFVQLRRLYQSTNPVLTVIHVWHLCHIYFFLFQLSYLEVIRSTGSSQATPLNWSATWPMIIPLTSHWIGESVFVV